MPGMHFKAMKTVLKAATVCCGLLLTAGAAADSSESRALSFYHTNDRLVGATEAAVRGPFLVAASAPGLLAGALAPIVTAVAVSFLSGVATSLGLEQLPFPWWLACGQALCGVILPLAVAAATLARHARAELRE